MTDDVLKEWNYTVKEDHRDGTSSKSQWAITVAQEKRAFKKAMAEGWTELSSAKAWGLHLIHGAPQCLGHLAAKSGSPNARAFIAFYDLSANTHGYPADYRQTREKPPSRVRSAWVKTKTISKAKASKIGQGKRCVL